MLNRDYLENISIGTPYLQPLLTGAVFTFIVKHMRVHICTHAQTCGYARSPETKPKHENAHTFTQTENLCIRILAAFSCPCFPSFRRRGRLSSCAQPSPMSPLSLSLSGLKLIHARAHTRTFPHIANTIGTDEPHGFAAQRIRTLLSQNASVSISPSSSAHAKRAQRNGEQRTGTAESQSSRSNSSRRSELAILC